jgi:hypothetical protein
MNNKMIDYQTKVLESFRENAQEILRLNRENAKEIQDNYDALYRESLEYNCQLIENGGFSIR